MSEVIRELTLNADRHPFCQIGDIHFSDEEPLHKIDLAKLTPVEFKQIKYNVGRGVLSTNGPLELPKPKEAVTEQSQASDAQSQQSQQNTNPLSIENLMKQEEKALKRLLAGKIPTVQRKAAELRPAQVSKLLALERCGKNRKSLLAFLEGMVNAQHFRPVITGGPAQGTDYSKVRESGLSDIVREEEEEVEIHFNDPE